MTPISKPVAAAAHGKVQSLPQLCSEAADHVARARLSLHDENYDAERALAHLDEAIDCLKRLFAHGRGAQDGGQDGTQDAAQASLRSA